jgi:hypothetical protein
VDSKRHGPNSWSWHLGVPITAGIEGDTVYFDALFNTLAFKKLGAAPQRQ